MHLKTSASLVTALQLISSARSYGTIQYVFPATCAINPTLSTGPGVSPASAPATGPPIPTGTVLPPIQYLLTVLPGTTSLQPRQVASAYIRANANTTADCGAAAPFLLSNGQLSSNDQFISTSGLVPHSPLVVSSFVDAISTTFSMTNGSSMMNSSTLSWTNSAFSGGRALFCIMNNTIQAVYNEQLPAGCAQISIGLVPVSSCQTIRPSSSATQTLGNGTIGTITSTSTGISSPSPTESAIGSIRGSNATAYPVGCLESSIEAPAVSPALAPIEVTDLEDCVDFCSSYAYLGVQSGFCVCGNSLLSSASPVPYETCNVPCADNVEQSCGGITAMAVYSISRSSGAPPSPGTIPTSTGTGSAATASTSGFTVSTGTPNCYDRSPFDQTINGGYLILCNTALPGFDLLAVNGTNLAECIAACNQYQSGPASTVCVAVTFNRTLSINQCRLKNNVTTVIPGGEDLSEAAIAVIGPFAPQITFESVNSTTNPTISSTLATSTFTTTTTSTTSMSSTTLIGTSSTTGTYSGPAPTVTNPSESLCPTHNGQVVLLGGSYYQVECSTGFVDDSLIGNTTTAKTLAECGGYCNLLNLAVPFSCVGVTLATQLTSMNCFLMSRITGTQYRPLNDSLRLIYPGYPTPTDPVLTGPSGAYSSSAGASSSTSITTSTSSSTKSTATAALCPAYNNQSVYFPSYGDNYEIQCSTTFADPGLPAIIASTLNECVNHCSFLNVNSETPQCVGVTFRTLAQTSPPSNNCFPKGSVVSIVRNVVGDDSARLLYQGYAGL